MQVSTGLLVADTDMEAANVKEQLKNELMLKLAPCLQPEKTQDAAMRITMALSGYTVSKEETLPTVYEGDINDQIIKKWLMAKLARGCSRRTVELYKNSVTMTLRKIGKPYNEITPDDVRVYLAIRVQNDCVTKTTANNERRNLSAFYFWLQKEEILLKNPMNKVEVIKETKKKKVAFSQMELEKLRYACETTLETALVEVLISTWARVSEIAQIQMSDIHDNKVLVHGKGDKDRDVFLNPKAQLAIDQYLKDRKDDNPYLFPRSKYAGDVAAFTKRARSRPMAEWYKYPDMIGDGHRNPDTIEATIRKIGKRAGVANAHPHRFRRTGATMALRTGMPLITVSKLLGHESIATTQIYLDISDKELEQAHEKYVN